MVAGTNVNGNKSLAKAIMSASAPSVSSIDKNKLLSGTQQGSVAPGVAGTTEVKFNDPLKFDGSIDLKINGVDANNKELMDNILKDPTFVRYMSRTVNAELKRSLNGNNK